MANGDNTTKAAVVSTQEDTVYELYLPKENCPPSESVDGPVSLFRLCQSDTPTPDDFKTAYERGVFLNHPLCLRCSLSSYSDLYDVERLKRRVRHFTGHTIVRGIVPFGAGVHQPTPTANEPSHMSWWPVRGLARHAYFLAA